jgi:hypothetical protein
MIQNLLNILQMCRNLVDFSYKIDEIVLTTILCINLILPLIGIFVGSIVSVIFKSSNTNLNIFKLQHNIAL